MPATKLRLSVRCLAVAVVLLCYAAVYAEPDSQAAIPQLKRDIVGWWLFDEGEGPTGEENWAIYDQSGRGNHGLRALIDNPNVWPRYESFSPNSANYNQSLRFASNTGCIKVQDDTSLDLDHDFTIECWARFENATGARNLVSKGEGAQTGYSLSCSADHFVFSVGTSTKRVSAESQQFQPEPNRWYHVAAVHDSDSATIRLFLNGKQVGSASCPANVEPNAEPLRFGSSAGAETPAMVWLDEIRLSSRVVPPVEFTNRTHHGPARIIFGDNLESYAAHGDWFSRRGGQRNHWRIIEETPAVSIQPTSEISCSGRYCHLLRHNEADPATDHEASLYYNLPIAATRGEAIVGMQGWVSFESIDHARLFWDQQVWAGRETHYGVTRTLLIGWVTYHGDGKHWDFDPDYQVRYAEGLGKWHYYNLVTDYQAKRLIAFQFDNDVWRLDDRQFDLLPEFFDPSLLPTIDHNIRLLETGKANERWSASFAQDDAALVVYRRADFNDDQRVDRADLAILEQHWHRQVPLGESGDATFDGQVNQEDVKALRKLTSTDTP